MIKNEFMGQQLIADFYGCDTSIIDSLDKTKDFIHKMCEAINTEIVEEAYHKFEPIGISAFAVITTSHMSIHTWPEFNYAAVDIFSCNGDLVIEICDYLKKLLKASDVKAEIITRDVGRFPRNGHGEAR